MDINKFELEITKPSNDGIPRILIKYNGEAIGAVEEATIKIKAVPEPSYVITIKRWRVIGNPDVEKLDEMKEYLTSTLGVYIKPFENNLELITEDVQVVFED